MVTPWIESGHCRSHNHCWNCRHSEAFRESILRAKMAAVRDFDCPDGYLIGQRGLGDLIERIAKPLAKAMNLDCMDESGNLKPDSGCAKRKQAANEFGRRIGLK